MCRSSETPWVCDHFCLRLFLRNVRLATSWPLRQLASQPIRVRQVLRSWSSLQSSWRSYPAWRSIYGTLHLHLLLWLLHALSPDTFFSKMENDLEYRKRVFRWIADCIKQSLPKDVDSFGLKKVSKVSVPPHTATL